MDFLIKNNIKENKKIIFFDLGANVGKITRLFIKTFTNYDYEIYMFEPNEKLLNNFKKDYNNDKIHIYPKIVGIHNEKQMFMIGNKKNSTNSKTKKVFLNHNKDKKKYTKEVLIETIDINDFILNQLKKIKDAYTIVKMDIEGSEYDILPKMLNNNTFDLIDILLIEFHGSDKKNQDIVKAIYNRHNTKVYKEITPGKYEFFKI